LPEKQVDALQEDKNEQLSAYAIFGNIGGEVSGNEPQ
jgi:hypothetical protein